MLRRTVAWMALFCALAGTAEAATLCVNAPGVIALTDNRGVEITENGRFESAFTVREGALYAMGKKGAYRLYDAQGQLLGDVEFSMIDDGGEALVFNSHQAYGAMNADGLVIIEPRWAQLTADGLGGWLALETDPLDEQADEILHINENGEIKQTGVYCIGGLERFSDGRMPFMDGDGRYGALDANGQIAVQPSWLYMGPFANGLAKVAGKDGMGMIDVSGRATIAPTYQWLERSDAMIVAWNGSSIDIYGPRGGQRMARLSGKVREIELVENKLVVNYEARTALYDANGRMLVQSVGSVCYATGTRGQLIASNGEWGERCQWLVNPDGSKASGMFQQLLPLCAERYAFLEMEGEAYESEVLGRSQTAWNYGNCRYGLMDGRGRVLTSAKYREIRPLGSDRLLLVGEDRVQIADRNGVVVKTWITTEASESSREAAE